MQRMSFLVLALGCLAYSGGLWAQALPIPAYLEKDYPPTALPNEMAVQTAEGCGIFLPRPDEVAIRSTPDLLNRIISSWRKHRWDGLCYQGLAFGPGAWHKQIGSQPNILRSSSTGWFVRGRNIGESTMRFEPTPYSPERTSWRYDWRGTAYSRNVPPTLGRLNPPKTDSYIVAFGPPDPLKAVSYTMRGSRDDSDMKANITIKRVTDKYLRTGNERDRWIVHECRDDSHCADMWLEMAVPTLRAAIQFQEQSEPEVAALKAQLNPLLTQLKAKHDALLHEQEKQRIATAKAKRAVQRKKIIDQANVDKHPVEMSSLNALLKRAMGSQQ